MKHTTIALTLVLQLPIMASGQTFTEDFSDPATFAERWTSADGTVILGPDGMPTGELREGGPGIVGVENGALVQRTTGPIPLGDPNVYPPGDESVIDLVNGGTQQAFVLSTLAQPIRDVIVRTKVHVDTATNAAIGFRGNVQTLSNYNVTASGAIGQFALARLENGVLERVEWFDEPAFGIGEDWWMEASAIGDQISLKVWQDGQSEPASPQFRWTDDVLTEGGIGLGSAVWNNNVTEPTVLNATFDDFSFQVVPEPSSLGLVFVGLFGMWVFGRGRKLA